METNTHRQSHVGRSQTHLLQQQRAMAGLVRFQSAPSSLIDADEFAARSAGNDTECATYFGSAASPTEGNIPFPQNQSLAYQNFGYVMDYVAPSSSWKSCPPARHSSLSSSFENGLGGTRLNPISQLGGSFGETWDDLEAVNGGSKGLPTTNESELQVMGFDLWKVQRLFQQMMELQESSVTFKTRAKRGCATHPRSIAERVRRTRISERMRKLQDLVPNMQRQTNTADMLDFAVDYIKELQKQVKVLSDTQANCLCSNMR